MFTAVKLLSLIINRPTTFLQQLTENHLTDNYGPPPPPPPPKQNTYKSNSNSFNSYQHSSSSRFPAQGLIPPSGVYGVPPGGSYAGLAIQHGSVSGNLKPWPQQGSAPTRPIQFRPPVPQGLIESIGQSVQHLDTFGVRPQGHQTNVYIPPPANEIPPPPRGLESLPLQGVQSFNVQQQNIPQALPLVQEQQQPQQQQYRLNGHECGHGPAFSGNNQVPFQTYGLPSAQHSFDAGKSNYNYDNSQSNSFQVNSGAEYSSGASLTSYDAPASGSISNQVSLIQETQSPASSYGPPPSGNPGDSEAYDTQLKTSSIIVVNQDQNDQIHAEALSQEQLPPEAESQTHEVIETQQRTASSSGGEQPLQIKAENLQEIHTVEQQSSRNVENLPGLNSAGLNIISAQQSQSLTIPVQGALGSYQLQFQAADPLGSSNDNSIDSPNHEKILSEGLLQSILSAIEQPGRNSVVIPQSSFDAVETHDDVDNFIRSQAGQEVLAEPNNY